MCMLADFVDVIASSMFKGALTEVLDSTLAHNASMLKKLQRKSIDL